jgi:hypothetical protein
LAGLIFPLRLVTAILALVESIDDVDNINVIHKVKRLAFMLVMNTIISGQGVFVGSKIKRKFCIKF